MQSRTELLEVAVTPSPAPQRTQAASCSCLATRELVWRLIQYILYIPAAYRLHGAWRLLPSRPWAPRGERSLGTPQQHNIWGHKRRSKTSCSQPHQTLLKLSAAHAASFPVQVGLLPSKERLPFGGEKWNLIIFITDPRSDSTQEEKQQRMWLLHRFGPPEPVSRTLAKMSGMTHIDDGAMNF